MDEFTEIREAVAKRTEPYRFHADALAKAWRDELPLRIRTTSSPGPASTQTLFCTVGPTVISSLRWTLECKQWNCQSDP